MKFFTNKHMIAAMIIAPILAVLAYFATDYVVGEKPHAAIDGANYKLVAGPDCRYQSGSCTLRNGDIKLVILAKRASENSNQIRLSLFSETPIEQALASFSTDDNALPTPFTADDEEGKWVSELSLQDSQTAPFRFVAFIQGSSYYVETRSMFVDYETSFSQENFAEEQD